MSGSSIVQRGKRFAVVCYAGIDPETKKQRQKWFGGFATRKEAEQFRVSLAHHPVFGAGAGPYSNPRLRTGDYLNAWLRERETLGTLRPSTVALTQTVIHSYLTPYLGHIPLSRLSPAIIQQLYVNLLDRRLKPSSVRRITGVLHAALDGAMKRGLIARNPQDNTTPPKIQKYKPAVPTVEQVERYLADAYKTTTPALYALYVIAATCGLRIGELTHLPADAADLTEGVLHIDQTKTDAGRRTILLPGQAIEAIKVALRWKKEQRLRLGRKYRDSGLLFVGEFGCRLNPKPRPPPATHKIGVTPVSAA